MESTTEPPRTPLAPLCDQWCAVLKTAAEDKHEKFGKYADEGRKFYASQSKFMWSDDYSRGPQGFLPKDSESGYFPTFRVSVNKVFEAVALYGPTLCFQNPAISVEALKTPGGESISPQALGIDPNDPYQMQMYQAMIAEHQNFEAVKGSHRGLYESYSNWLQGESNKKLQMRRAITETIVAGASMMVSEVYRPPGSQIRYPRSKWKTIEDLLVDPDANCWEDVQWVALRNIAPINLVSRHFGVPKNWLKGKGHYESANMQGATHGNRDEKSRMKRNGESHDLIVYHEIYSRNGFGQRLRWRDGYMNPKLARLDQLGDFCKIVVADGAPFPLNIPPHALDEEDDESLFMRAQWETPFWMDEGSEMGWPFSLLYFYDNPGCVWPVSIIRPAISEIKFVNWCLSFLADKVASQCQTLVAVAKESAAQIQDQLQSGSSPFTVLELEKILGDVGKTISFIQAPNFPSDIWKMLSDVLQIIDRRTGLTELMYGQTATSMRSATEATVKQQNLAIRPDDMKSQTESWVSDIATKEMQVARWHLSGSDVAPVLGPLGARIWDEQIMTQDPDSLTRNFHFRVHAGSMARPNRAAQLQDLTTFGNNALQVLQGYAMQGQVGPWNTYMRKIGELMGIDLEGMLLPEPDPNEAQQQAQQESQARQAELQTEMQLKQAELQAKIQERQAQLQLSAQESQQGMEMESARFQQEMAQDAAEHDQEMRQSAEEHQLSLRQMALTARQKQRTTQ